MPADYASDGLVRAHIVFFCILFSIPPKKMLEVLFQVLYVLADDASNVLVWAQQVYFHTHTHTHIHTHTHTHTSYGGVRPMSPGSSLSPQSSMRSILTHTHTHTHTHTLSLSLSFSLSLSLSHTTTHTHTRTFGDEVVVPHIFEAQSVLPVFIANSCTHKKMLKSQLFEAQSVLPIFIANSCTPKKKCSKVNVLVHLHCEVTYIRTFQV